MRLALDKHIGDLAQTVDDLNLEPGLCIDALFAEAQRSRMPEGPYANMLGSRKYLLGALARYLNVPAEAVVERARPENMIARIQKDYDQAAITLSGTSEPTRCHVPAAYRMIFVQHSEPALKRFLSEFADDVAHEIRCSAALAVWLESMGWTIEGVLSYKTTKLHD